MKSLAPSRRGAEGAKFLVQRTAEPVSANIVCGQTYSATLQET